MSLVSQEEIICGNCQKSFIAELWSAINVSTDPELRQEIIDGELNLVCCPYCGEMFYAEHFLLYHDPEEHLLVFVYPSAFSQQRSFWQKKMESDFQKASQLIEGKIDYPPELMFGLQELAEFLRQEDEKSDEIAILTYVAKELGLELFHFDKVTARHQGLVKVLPVPSGKSVNRENILKGLDKLLSYNPDLVNFFQTRQKIMADPTWKPQTHSRRKNKTTSRKQR